MNNAKKLALVCLLLCLMMVACALLSACKTGEIVSKPSLDIFYTTNPLMNAFSSYFAGRPISEEIIPNDPDAKVFCYVSADPSKGNKEEVQLCDEQIPNAYHIKDFKFHANVEGAHCATKQIAKDSNITTITWLPFVGSANGWVEIDEDRYLEAIIKVDDHIVGYVLSCYRYFSWESWELIPIVSEEFPKVNGRYQNITEEYLQQLAKSAVHCTMSSEFKSLNVVRRFSEVPLVVNNPDGIRDYSAYPIGNKPVEFEVLPNEPDAQVFCYVSADPSKGNKEEVQLCDETMPDAYNIKKFKFNSNVKGANCATKQIAKDSNATTIRWLPFVGSANGWVEIKEDRYLEVVIKENGNIVTYVLFLCDYAFGGDWLLQPLVLQDFPQVDGKYQNITEEYLQKLASISLS